MNMWGIILLTLFGVAVLLWLVFGINWRSSRNYERMHRLLKARMQAEDTEPLQRLLFANNLTMCVEQRFRPLAMLLAKNGRPSVSVSDPEIIISGRRKHDLLIGDIQNAKESIHMEYFHFGIDKSSRRIRRMLMAKARQGVKVRFINENIANWPIPNLYFRSMRKAGVEVVNFSRTWSLLRFLMTLSYRDHRKIVVIDNRIGYTGGMNINDHYFYQWRDTHLRLTGEAVASLQYAFLDTWQDAEIQMHTPLLPYSSWDEEKVTPIRDFPLLHFGGFNKQWSHYKGIYYQFLDVRQHRSKSAVSLYRGYHSSGRQSHPFIPIDKQWLFTDVDLIGLVDVTSQPIFVQYIQEMIASDGVKKYQTIDVYTDELCQSIGTADPRSVGWKLIHRYLRKTQRHRRSLIVRGVDKILKVFI